MDNTEQVPLRKPRVPTPSSVDDNDDSPSTESVVPIIYSIKISLKVSKIYFLCDFYSLLSMVQSVMVQMVQLVVTVIRPNSLIGCDFVITECLTMDPLKITERLKVA